MCPAPELSRMSASMAATQELSRRSRRWAVRFSRAIALFVADLEATKKSPETIRGYTKDLWIFHKTLRRDTVLDITPETIREAMRRWSSDDVAQNTLYRRQTAIRSFCRWGRKQQRLWMENPTDLVDAIPQGECLCLLYTSDAADERSSVDLGGR